MAICPSAVCHGLHCHLMRRCRPWCPPRTFQTPTQSSSRSFIRAAPNSTSAVEFASSTTRAWPWPCCPWAPRVEPRPPRTCHAKRYRLANRLALAQSCSSCRWPTPAIAGSHLHHARVVGVGPHGRAVGQVMQGQPVHRGEAELLRVLFREVHQEGYPKRSIAG